MHAMTENWDCFPYCGRQCAELRTGWWLRVQQEELFGRRAPACSSEGTADIGPEGTEVLRAMEAKDQEVLTLLTDLG